MMKFDWLLFDLDNTIFDFSGASRMALDLTLSPLVTKNLDAIKETYHIINRQVWDQYEDNTLSIDQLPITRATQFLTKTQISNITPSHFNQTYLDHLANHSQYLPTVEETLKNLTQTNIKMAIITNGLSYVQRQRWSKTNLSNYFTDIFIAEEIGKPKPNKYYFDYVHGKIGRPNRQKVLVVGDNVVSDIKGGNDFGYQTCWLRHPHQRLAGVPAHFQIDQMDQLLSIVHPQ